MASEASQERHATLSQHEGQNDTFKVDTLVVRVRTRGKKTPVFQ